MSLKDAKLGGDVEINGIRGGLSELCLLADSNTNRRCTNESLKFVLPSCQIK
jgi:hypothetical protein